MEESTQIGVQGALLEFVVPVSELVAWIAVAVALLLARVPTVTARPLTLVVAVLIIRQAGKTEGLRDLAELARALFGRGRRR